MAVANTIPLYVKYFTRIKLRNILLIRCMAEINMGVFVSPLAKKMVCKIFVIISIGSEKAYIFKQLTTAKEAVDVNSPLSKRRGINVSDRKNSPMAQGKAKNREKNKAFSCIKKTSLSLLVIFFERVGKIMVPMAVPMRASGSCEILSA